MFYNIDLNSARAYATSAALGDAMWSYDDMQSKWVNKIIQLKITAFFQDHQQQQQEKWAGESNNSIPSKANVENTMLMFSGFGDEEKEPQPLIISMVPGVGGAGGEGLKGSTHHHKYAGVHFFSF